MQNNVCKSCGGDIRREGNYYVCRFCGSRWTIDADSDVHVIDRANAWSALRDYDFEKSVELFENIIMKEPDNHEAYWGRALANAGIVYVTDLDENKKVPTCNSISESSFLEGRDVKKAISLAPADIADSYRKQAEHIESIRSEWLKKASKEPPYDVFICFKDSDRENNIERTRDSYDAQDLYYALTSKGYKVFFSRVSLRNKISEHYEPYIYNAIKTAKVMIVFGEKPEYFSAVWVKNEWNRFRARIERGEKDKNSLVVAYKGIDPGDLPSGLRSRQCLNAAEITFLDDLTSHIEKVVNSKPKSEPSEKQAPDSKTKAAETTTVPPQKKSSRKAFAVMITCLVLIASILIGDLVFGGFGILTFTDTPDNSEGLENLTGDYIFQIGTGDKDSITVIPSYTADIYVPENTETFPDYYFTFETDDPYQYPSEDTVPDDGYTGDQETNGPDVYETTDTEGQIAPPNIEDLVISVGLQYEYADDGISYMITGRGDCTDTDIVIPSSIDGKPVTEIAADAFYNDKELRSIYVPSSVKRIGDCAFYGCDSIESMVLPFVGETADVTVNSHLGYIFGAYSWDEHYSDVPHSLKMVTVTGNSDIGEHAFHNLSGIEAIFITGEVSHIGEGAISACYNLKTLVLPDSICSMGNHAVSECSNLTYIEHDNGKYLPMGDNDYFMLVEVLDKNVRTFTIAEGTRIIGSEAFSSSRRLQSISIPDSVRNIGNKAFGECVALESVTFGSGLITINDEAFMNCSALAALVLPDSLKTIGKYAFSYCTGLKTVSVPKELESFGLGAFMSCSSMESIVLPFVGRDLESSKITLGMGGDDEDYQGGDRYEENNGIGTLGWIFGASSCGSNTDYVPKSLKTVEITNMSLIGDNAFFGCQNIESIVLPDGITAIGTSAFDNCFALQNISLPESVIAIGRNAFYYCTSLKEINIPSGVTEIPNYAFCGCSALTVINNLHDGISKIGRQAFNMCSSLQSFDFPEGLKSIGTMAFIQCSALESLYLPDGLESIGQGAFTGCYALKNISIPFIGLSKTNTDGARLSDAFGYGSDDAFSNLDTIELRHGEEVPDHAFDAWPNVKNIILPETLKRIGYQAFSNCRSLVNINIPDGVEIIGSEAFIDCIGLVTVELPQTLKKIESKAFYGCVALESVVIPDSVEYIAFGSFGHCTSLRSITLPFIGTVFDDPTYTNFGYIFGANTGSYNYSYVPSNLEYVHITGDLSEIKDGAFSSCDHIKEIKLPDTIEILGSHAFYNCTALECINMPSSLAEIGEYAFTMCDNLMAIEMPEKLANIGAYAFQSCNALESVKLNNGLRIIGQYSFYECTGLMEISVPDSVETIGISAFGECSNLAKITLPFIGSGDDESESPFGYVFGANSWSENGLVPEALKTVIITNGDGSILANAFHYCQYIEYLTLPDNTTTIEEYAFHNCSALKEITFGSELATVGNDAFNGCPSLTTVNFGGTEDQWNSIVFGDNNFQITDAEIKLVDESSIPAQTAPMGERQYVRDGNYIYFGEYPQTLKSDSVEITDTQDERGYYLGSDGCYYAKITATPHNDVSGDAYIFSNSATVVSGEIYYFKVEPIRWRIMHEGGGKAFIMCDSIILNRRFDDATNNYAESEIRQWLNNEFYNTIFTELQREFISTVTVDNSVASTGYEYLNQYTCENTRDKIFLLSCADLQNSTYGMNVSENRRLLVSDYARATGAMMSTDSDTYGTGWWWTRSPSNSEDYICRLCTKQGYIDVNFRVSVDILGIVPAMYIWL